MQDLKKFKIKLSTYTRNDIEFTEHAKIRIKQRQISEDIIIENLLNPEKLKYVNKQFENSREAKYDCYFEYTKNLSYRFVIILKSRILVVTVIKINKKWQNTTQKRLK